jgi:DMSO/TMAO reductase YedYZ heme-binding membrane subunit
VPKGWSIVGWSALMVGGMCAALLAVAGTGEEGLRVVIRATARTSVGLFTLAFVASALSRAWPTAASHWLAANRRYLGVSFAVSHLAHLCAILTLVGWSIRTFVNTAGVVTAVAGGIGYLVVAAMAATSFDRTAAWLGPRRWRRLHTTGVYYLWGVFLATFAPRVLTAPGVYAPITLGLLTALGLRLCVRTGAARDHVPEGAARTVRRRSR